MICLILLGLPVLTMELSIGRAAQASPVRMYQKLEKPGQKWHLHGYWPVWQCVPDGFLYGGGRLDPVLLHKFAVGQTADLGFAAMIPLTPAST